MKRILLLLAITCCTLTSIAQVTTRVVRDSLFIPWELVYGPDDHVWFTQKNGYVCRLNPVTTHIDTLLHEPAVQVLGEGGMLGMALHPNFTTSPYVYVAYNYNQGGAPKERIVRYNYNASTNTLGSYVTILDNIDAANIHNGCRLLIMGDKLFISTGDAANTAYAQDVNSLNGKILRINLDGTIPSDNPYPNNPVWSIGHRNPQGMVFAKNKLFASEHGPSTDDEINIIQPGINYGWPHVTGQCDAPSEAPYCGATMESEFSWTPTIAVCGIDYYDLSLPMLPQFGGSLITTTLKDSVLYQLETSQNGDSILGVSVVPFFGNQYGRLRDICISPLGSVFISTSNSPANGTPNPIDKIIELYDPSFTLINDVNKKNGIDVYPNPANDYAIVRIAQGGKESNLVYQYILSSIDGKFIDRGIIKSSTTRLNMSGLVPGIYQLKLTDNNGKSYNRSIQKL